VIKIRPDVSLIACYDRGYGRPSGRPRVLDPATYCSRTPRIQPPAVARWHTHLHGLATVISETSGLGVALLDMEKVESYNGSRWNYTANNYDCKRDSEDRVSSHWR
jgi:hypothetical protein